MSGESPRTSADAEFLASNAHQIAENCTSDLTALLGKSIELRPSAVEHVELEKVAESDEPVVDQLCRIGEAPGADLHLLMPRAEALRFAALQMGHGADDVADRELGAEDRAAFQVVMKLVASNLSGAFEEAGLPEVVAKDARVIPEPASDPTWLVGERFLRLRFHIGMEPLPDGRLDVLMDDASDPELEDAPERTLYFVADPQLEPECLEGLGEALGWSVAAIAPERLREELADVSASAGAIVVPWEVGGRAGLELVEVLLRDEHTRGVPVLMSSEVPTRAMVGVALRAGARSFLMCPYQGEELRQRVLEARREPGAASAAQGEGSANAGEGIGSRA